MRIEVILISQTPLRLPRSYNHIIQGVIYSNLEPVLAKFLHQEGFNYGRRRFRLFTFSRILGRIKTLQGSFEFTPPFRLIVTTHKTEYSTETLEKCRDCIKFSENSLDKDSHYGR
jgi:CRISPR-associated endoribonuclease Cas6